MSKTNIEWKDIPGYERIYQASNSGLVKRLAGTPKCKSDRILKQANHNAGYVQVALSKSGKPKTFLVHQLVMLTFVGESKDLWVNHKNGDKQDNRLENLEYVTPGENNKHAYDTGLRRKLYGEDNPNSSISDEDIYFIHIAWLHARFEMGGISGIARQFGISRTSVWDIIHGRRGPRDD